MAAIQFLIYQATVVMPKWVLVKSLADFPEILRLCRELDHTCQLNKCPNISRIWHLCTIAPHLYYPPLYLTRIWWRPVWGFQIDFNDFITELLKHRSSEIDAAVSSHSPPYRHKDINTKYFEKKVSPGMQIFQETKGRQKQVSACCAFDGRCLLSWQTLEYCSWHCEVWNIEQAGKHIC